MNHANAVRWPNTNRNLRKTRGIMGHRFRLESRIGGYTLTVMAVRTRWEIHPIKEQLVDMSSFAQYQDKSKLSFMVLQSSTPRCCTKSCRSVCRELYCDTHAVNLSATAEEVASMFKVRITPISGGTPQELAYAESAVRTVGQMSRSQHPSSYPPEGERRKIPLSDNNRTNT